MQGLKKRRDFLAAAGGRKTVRNGFVLQTRRRADDGPARFGFTVTKKTARKAVQRNRIRRRLKEAVRLLPSELIDDGYDHVLIGRRGILSENFAHLGKIIQTSILAVTAAPGAGPRLSGDNRQNGK